VIRTFEQHQLRRTRFLNGQWDFAIDPEQIGRTEGWETAFPAHARKMYVPSCWNNELGLYDYEGVAWYRTAFTLLRRGHVRLVFHAVMGEAEVYVDGKRVGSHYGSFTAFDVILPDLEEGVHTLTVRTDNTHTPQTIPLERVDWHHYGGMIRPVELQELPDIYIERLCVKYNLDYSNKIADVQVDCTLRSLTDHDSSVPLTLGCSGGGPTAVLNEVFVPALARAETHFTFRMEEVRLWEAGCASLYSFRVHTPEDDLTERTGFRKLEAVNKTILLNGRPVYFKGVNRHEEHPEWGFAFPPKLMQKDLDIIKHLGCNSIRGSHYPNSQYWLDLLDEQGILFWSEIPLWQFSPHHMVDPVIQERAVTMLREMIAESYHHPSIVFWSVNNECHTHTEEGLAFNTLLVNEVRAMDDSRLVAFASNRALEDLTFALFDVIGINQYYGWYDGKTEKFADFLKEFAAYARKMGAADKPVVMSEFGGAGIFGDVGWEENRMYSEDYQAKMLEDALKIFRNDPNIQGTFIWQFADIRTDTPRFRDRARGFNNKGIVNEYRKPKQSYRIVKRIYESWE